MIQNMLSLTYFDYYVWKIFPLGPNIQIRLLPRRYCTKYRSQNIPRKGNSSKSATFVLQIWKISIRLYFGTLQYPKRWWIRSFLRSDGWLNTNSYFANEVERESGSLIACFGGIFLLIYLFDYSIVLFVAQNIMWNEIKFCVKRNSKSWIWEKQIQ